jgi:hypothetical protein
MSVRVMRLSPSGKRYAQFYAPTLDMAWAYFVTDKMRKSDGRVWIDADYQPGIQDRRGEAARARAHRTRRHEEPWTPH